MVRRAIVIFPPAADVVRIEAVRRRFDSLAEAIPAHVTLVFPFDSDISGPDLLRHVETATTGLGAFAMTLEGLSCTEDHVLFLHVAEGSSLIGALHRRLYSGLLESNRSVQAFVPHMTIGRFNSSTACTAALESPHLEDSAVRTVVNAVSVYRISADGVRSIESEVALG